MYPGYVDIMQRYHTGTARDDPQAFPLLHIYYAYLSKYYIK